MDPTSLPLALEGIAASIDHRTPIRRERRAREKELQDVIRDPRASRARSTETTRADELGRRGRGARASLATFERANGVRRR
jgi:hypothetical protein